MPGIASATGLISARVRPVYRPKPKRVELSGSTIPAPFALRPFSGLFNPYPYGCSVLCNHPADCEAKDVVRRAKDTWATEGKALLLPEEMEMIRASLVAGGGGRPDVGGNAAAVEATNADATPVPEELFRKYTETDSRPLTPAPTLASGIALTNRAVQLELPPTCNPRERTTLVLDLRTNSHTQESETFTWHALTLEPPPTPRKTEVSAYKPLPRQQPHSPAPSPVPPRAPPSPIEELCELNSPTNAEGDVESGSDELVIVRRRGKRLRKRKCRRGSTYGQQTEVRDLLEPTETQVSQIGDGSRRTSVHVSPADPGDSTDTPKKVSLLTPGPTMPSSFISPEILKHLCRELDRDKVEAEFSTKRKIAYEEALRVKNEGHLGVRSSRQTVASSPMGKNAPMVFSRQAARFEILNSQSLRGLTPLDYLGKHAFVTSGRKVIFGRAFHRFNEETLHGARYISPNDIPEALREAIGKSLSKEQEAHLKSLIGDMGQPLEFRAWCGLCAVVERLFCPLPQKEVDPPTWLERADFETLERRLRSNDVDPKLCSLLMEIRDR
ncbi:hypothetical protein KM043_015213 [Ampulex compressa]|nr:hypothetical protein KM043_015213 [Ampulex compressa]